MATRAAVKRPTKVKVLAQAYSIHWLDENEWYQQKHGGDSVGVTSRDAGTIHIRCDSMSSEDALRSTLLHEVLHACTQTNRLIEQSLAEVSDGEEFIVALLAPILLDVMSTNPNLLAYLINTGASA